MVKKIIMSDKSIKELTFEEILKKYKPFLNNCAYKALKITQSIKVSASVMDFEDYYQIGVQSLYKAYRDYDISYNCVFITYAFTKVKCEILRISRDIDHLRMKDNQLIRNTLFSLDAPKNSDSDDKTLSLFDCIEDKNSSFENSINKLVIEEALNHLSPKSRKIIELRYFKGLTQIMIAKKLNISQVQVSRYEKKALIALRNFMNDDTEGEVIKKMVNKNNDNYNVNEIFAYLRDNADNGDSFLITLNRYCQSHNYNVTSISKFLSQNYLAEYNNMCSLYKARKNNANSIDYNAIIDYLTDNSNKCMTCFQALTEYCSEHNLRARTILSYLTKNYHDKYSALVNKYYDNCINNALNYIKEHLSEKTSCFKILKEFCSQNDFSTATFISLIKENPTYNQEYIRIQNEHVNNKKAKNISSDNIKESSNSEINLIKNNNVDNKIKINSLDLDIGNNNIKISKEHISISNIVDNFYVDLKAADKISSCANELVNISKLLNGLSFVQF